MMHNHEIMNLVFFVNLFSFTSTGFDISLIDLSLCISVLEMHNLVLFVQKLRSMSLDQWGRWSDPKWNTKAVLAERKQADNKVQYNIW